MIRKFLFAVCVIAMFAGCRGTVIPRSVVPSGGVTVHGPYSDNMVLQRNMPIPVRGTGEPGKQIIVTFQGKSHTTVVDVKGSWRIELPPYKASATPSIMTVAGTEKITFRNILIGDVWLGSGQSNMWWPVKRSAGAETAIAKSANSQIRLLSYGGKSMASPLENRPGSWKVCGPDTVGGFSAVLYNFGKEIQQKEKVPVGLIHSSVGGTAIERWISRQGYEADPVYAGLLKRADHARDDYKGAYEKYNQEIRAWLKRNIGDYGPGAGVKAGWSRPCFNDSTWKTMTLPGTWEKVHIGLDGSVWFRKQIKIPAGWVGKPLKLSLGRIDDYDATFCNGTKVGQTNTNTMNPWAAKRLYTIPGKLTTGTQVTLAVQVFDIHGGGGVRARAKEFYIANGKEKVTLAGPWKYTIEKVHTVKADDPVPSPPANAKRGLSSLYNGMINPLIKFPIRGVLWYQGESNARRASEYARLQTNLIRDWRRKWWQDDLPFFIVQLASFESHSPHNPLPAPTSMPDPNKPSSWALLREAQMTALSEPNTGVAVTIDIGDRSDIHPANKKDVGKRLALIARNISYGQDVAFSGPVYKGMKTEDNKVRLFFRHAGGGLTAKGGPLKWFAIAGKDGVYYWANAVIDGSTVVVSSPRVKQPVAVRYAWARNPEGCNLFNKAGLPASPFRTNK